eukprot:g12863.t1
MEAPGKRDYVSVSPDRAGVSRRENRRLMRLVSQNADESGPSNPSPQSAVLPLSADSSAVPPFPLIIPSSSSSTTTASFTISTSPSSPFAHPLPSPTAWSGFPKAHASATSPKNYLSSPSPRKRARASSVSAVPYRASPIGLHRTPRNGNNNNNRNGTGRLRMVSAAEGSGPQLPMNGRSNNGLPFAYFTPTKGLPPSKGSENNLAHGAPPGRSRSHSSFNSHAAMNRSTPTMRGRSHSVLPHGSPSAGVARDIRVEIDKLVATLNKTPNFSKLVKYSLDCLDHIAMDDNATQAVARTEVVQALLLVLRKNKDNRDVTREVQRLLCKWSVDETCARNIAEGMGYDFTSFIPPPNHRGRPEGRNGAMQGRKGSRSAQPHAENTQDVLTRLDFMAKLSRSGDQRTIRAFLQAGALSSIANVQSDFTEDLQVQIKAAEALHRLAANRAAASEIILTGMVEKVVEVMQRTHAQGAVKALQARVIEAKQAPAKSEAAGGEGGKTTQGREDKAIQELVALEQLAEAGVGLLARVTQEAKKEDKESLQRAGAVDTLTLLLDAHHDNDGIEMNGEQALIALTSKYDLLTALDELKAVAMTASFQAALQRLEGLCLVPELADELWERRGAKWLLELIEHALAESQADPSNVVARDILLSALRTLERLPETDEQVAELCEANAPSLLVQSIETYATDGAVCAAALEALQALSEGGTQAEGMVHAGVLSAVTSAVECHPQHLGLGRAALCVAEAFAQRSPSLLEDEQILRTLVETLERHSADPIAADTAFSSLTLLLADSNVAGRLVSIGLVPCLCRFVTRYSSREGKHSQSRLARPEPGVPNGDRVEDAKRLLLLDGLLALKQALSTAPEASLPDFLTHSSEKSLSSLTQTWRGDHQISAVATALLNLYRSAQQNRQAAIEQERKAAEEREQQEQQLALSIRIQAAEEAEEKNRDVADSPEDIPAPVDDSESDDTDAEREEQIDKEARPSNGAIDDDQEGEQLNALRARLATPSGTDNPEYLRSQARSRLKEAMYLREIVLLREVLLDVTDPTGQDTTGSKLEDDDPIVGAGMDVLDSLVEAARNKLRVAIAEAEEEGPLRSPAGTPRAQPLPDSEQAHLMEPHRSLSSRLKKLDAAIEEALTSGLRKADDVVLQAKEVRGKLERRKAEEAELSRATALRLDGQLRSAMAVSSPELLRTAFSAVRQAQTDSPGHTVVPNQQLLQQATSLLSQLQEEARHKLRTALSEQPHNLLLLESVLAEVEETQALQDSDTQVDPVLLQARTHIQALRKQHTETARQALQQAVQSGDGVAIRDALAQAETLLSWQDMDVQRAVTRLHAAIAEEKSRLQLLLRQGDYQTLQRVREEVLTRQLLQEQEPLLLELEERLQAGADQRAYATQKDLEHASQNRDANALRAALNNAEGVLPWQDKTVQGSVAVLTDLMAAERTLLLSILSQPVFHKEREIYRTDTAGERIQSEEEQEEEEEESIENGRVVKKLASTTQEVEDRGVLLAGDSVLEEAKSVLRRISEKKQRRVVRKMEMATQARHAGQLRAALQQAEAYFPADSESEHPSITRGLELLKDMMTETSEKLLQYMQANQLEELTEEIERARQTDILLSSDPLLIAAVSRRDNLLTARDRLAIQKVMDMGSPGYPLLRVTLRLVRQNGVLSEQDSLLVEASSLLSSLASQDRTRLTQAISLHQLALSANSKRVQRGSDPDHSYSQQLHAEQHGENSLAGALGLAYCHGVLAGSRSWQRRAFLASLPSGQSLEKDSKGAVALLPGETQRERRDVDGDINVEEEEEEEEERVLVDAELCLTEERGRLLNSLEASYRSAVEAQRKPSVTWMELASAATALQQCLELSQASPLPPSRERNQARREVEEEGLKRQCQEAVGELKRGAGEIRLGGALTHVEHCWGNVRTYQTYPTDVKQMEETEALQAAARDESERGLEEAVDEVVDKQWLRDNHPLVQQAQSKLEELVAIRQALVLAQHAQQIAQEAALEEEASKEKAKRQALELELAAGPSGLERSFAHSTAPAAPPEVTYEYWPSLLDKEYSHNWEEEGAITIGGVVIKPVIGTPWVSSMAMASPVAEMVDKYQPTPLPLGRGYMAVAGMNYDARRAQVAEGYLRSTKIHPSPGSGAPPPPPEAGYVESPVPPPPPTTPPNDSSVVSPDRNHAVQKISRKLQKELKRLQAAYSEFEVQISLSASDLPPLSMHKPDCFPLAVLWADRDAPDHVSATASDWLEGPAATARQAAPKNWLEVARTRRSKRPTRTPKWRKPLVIPYTGPGNMRVLKITIFHVPRDVKSSSDEVYDCPVLGEVALRSYELADFLQEDLDAMFRPSRSRSAPSLSSRPSSSPDFFNQRPSTDSTTQISRSRTSTVSRAHSFVPSLIARNSQEYKPGQPVKTEKGVGLRPYGKSTRRVVMDGVAVNESDISAIRRSLTLTSKQQQRAQMLGLKPSLAVTCRVVDVRELRMHAIKEQLKEKLHALLRQYPAATAADFDSWLKQLKTEPDPTQLNSLELPPINQAQHQVKQEKEADNTARSSAAVGAEKKRLKPLPEEKAGLQPAVANSAAAPPVEQPVVEQQASGSLAARRLRYPSRPSSTTTTPFKNQAPLAAPNSAGPGIALPGKETPVTASSASARSNSARSVSFNRPDPIQTKNSSPDLSLLDKDKDKYPPSPPPPPPPPDEDEHQHDSAGKTHSVNGTQSKGMGSWKRLKDMESSEPASLLLPPPVPSFDATVVQKDITPSSDKIISSQADGVSRRDSSKGGRMYTEENGKDHTPNHSSSSSFTRSPSIKNKVSERMGRRSSKGSEPLLSEHDSDKGVPRRSSSPELEAESRLKSSLSLSHISYHNRSPDSSSHTTITEEDEGQDKGKANGKMKLNSFSQAAEKMRTNLKQVGREGSLKNGTPTERRKLTQEADEDEQQDERNGSGQAARRVVETLGARKRREARKNAVVAKARKNNKYMQLQQQEEEEEEHQEEDEELRRKRGKERGSENRDSAGGGGSEQQVVASLLDKKQRGKADSVQRDRTDSVLLDKKQREKADSVPRDRTDSVLDLSVVGEEGEEEVEQDERQQIGLAKGISPFKKEKNISPFKKSKNVSPIKKIKKPPRWDPVSKSLQDLPTSRLLPPPVPDDVLPPPVPDDVPTSRLVPPPVPSDSPSHAKTQSNNPLVPPPVPSDLLPPPVPCDSPSHAKTKSPFLSSLSTSRLVPPPVPSDSRTNARSQTANVSSLSTSRLLPPPVPSDSPTNTKSKSANVSSLSPSRLVPPPVPSDSPTNAKTQSANLSSLSTSRLIPPPVPSDSPSHTKSQTAKSSSTYPVPSDSPSNAKSQSANLSALSSTPSFATPFDARSKHSSPRATPAFPEQTTSHSPRATPAAFPDQPPVLENDYDILSGKSSPSTSRSSSRYR